jgi:hypothetical protein
MFQGRMDPNFLEMVAEEVTIGEEGGGWTPEDIQGAAELKLLMGSGQHLEQAPRPIDIQPGDERRTGS